MISVLMGVSRVDSYLAAAVGSVLAQSHSAMELILVANGTNADTVAGFLAREFGHDERVRILKSQIPQLAHALNMGIDAAAFDFVGRMDADDVAHADWLAGLFAFMQAGQLDVAGCDLRLIDAAGQAIGERQYPRGTRINRLLPFKNCFAHNTVIMRKSVLLAARGYNAGLNTEDYDLWLRLRRQNVRWDNLNKCLVDYRVHGEASQRRLLGYAEAAGLAAREWVLNKSLVNLAAFAANVIKALFRAR